MEDINPGFCVKLGVHDNGPHGSTYEPAEVYRLRDEQKVYMDYFYDYTQQATQMQNQHRLQIDITANKRNTRGAMITQITADGFVRTIRKMYPALYDNTNNKKHYFDNNKASIVDKPFPGVSLEYVGAGSMVSFYLGTKADFANDIDTLHAVIEDLEQWETHT